MRKVRIMLIALVMVISMATNVFAATGSITAGASSGTVEKGKEFTVTIVATADNPIDGMYTKFSYDKTVLSLEGTTVGSNYGNNSSGEEILVVCNAETSPTSATLYTLKFKVLETANVESTEITFSESALHLNVNGSIEEYEAEIEEIDITIKGEAQENTPAEDNTNTGNTNTNNNTTKLPQTGVESTSLIAMVVLGVVAIVSYVSYRRYRNI